MEQDSMVTVWSWHNGSDSAHVYFDALWPLVFAMLLKIDEMEMKIGIQEQINKHKQTPATNILPHTFSAKSKVNVASHKY